MVIDALIDFDGGAITQTVDGALRVRFALECYHGALSDSLNDRYRARGNDAGCDLLRSQLTALESQLTRVREAIARAYTEKGVSHV
jgi:hypothetical protein